MKTQKKTVLTDVKKFTVERNTWRRGKMNSCLLNRNGKRCCLGFYAEACGVNSTIIRNLETPQHVVQILEEGSTVNLDYKVVSRRSNVRWKTKLVTFSLNSRACNHLMDINDEPDLSDEEREKALTAAFKKLGIKVTFR